MDHEELSLRDQVVAINHWLEQVYSQPMLLSDLLLREGLDTATIDLLKQQHLPAFLVRLQTDLRGWLGRTLNERFVLILTRRFSLDGRAKTILATLAEHYDLSRERIRQIEHGGLRRLRTGARRAALGQIVLGAAQATLGLPVTASVAPKQPLERESSDQPPPDLESGPERHLNTFQQTLALFEAGQTPAAIAVQRYLSVETIYNHLAHWIERGEIAVDEVIDAELYGTIEQAILQAGADAEPKDIKVLLPEALYGQIACVQADLRRSAIAES